MEADQKLFARHVGTLRVSIGSDPRGYELKDELLRPLILYGHSLTLAVAIDTTSLSVALPTMSTTLRGTAIETFWAGTSFMLSSSVMQPSIVSMSDITGRRYVR